MMAPTEGRNGSGEGRVRRLDHRSAAMAIRIRGQLGVDLSSAAAAPIPAQRSRPRSCACHLVLARRRTHRVLNADSARLRTPTRSGRTGAVALWLRHAGMPAGRIVRIDTRRIFNSVPQRPLGKTLTVKFLASTSSEISSGAGDVADYTLLLAGPTSGCSTLSLQPMAGTSFTVVADSAFWHELHLPDLRQAGSRFGRPVRSDTALTFTYTGICNCGRIRSTEPISRP